MTGPLVPVPSLPYRVATGTDTSVSVRPEISDAGPTLVIANPHDETYDVVWKKDVPAFAAALLSAAGLEHHRVIDLGGPLPDTWRDGGYTHVPGASWSDTSPDTVLLGNVRDNLAVLQARAIATQHRSAELEAVRAAITEAVDEGWSPTQHATVTRILDALAAVRTEATS